jgi:hypothetical protein
LGEYALNALGQVRRGVEKRCDNAHKRLSDQFSPMQRGGIGEQEITMMTMLEAQRYLRCLLAV